MTVLARLDAAMGLEAECRATVDELFGLAAHSGMGTMRVYGLAALGLLELGLGRSGTAVEHLDEAARICVALGHRDPSIVPFAPDRIEALVREGERGARRGGAGRVRGDGAAGAARLADRGGGPLPRAAGTTTSSRGSSGRMPRTAQQASPFELGRTELCHGERLRRARRAREARERLRSALERFEALGAEPWAARARAELRAAGGAVGAARQAPTRELTPQELEVALAVARGATNREVASALFVSPKTIEVHLSRIFRKLGVRSRTELAKFVWDALDRARRSRAGVRAAGSVGGGRRRAGAGRRAGDRQDGAARPRARARRRGVLTATGAEAEADLPFAALLSLLRPVLDRRAELPRGPGAGAGGSAGARAAGAGRPAGGARGGARAAVGGGRRTAGAGGGR